MIQHSYKADSRKEYISYLEEVQQSEEYRKARSVLVQLYIEMWSLEDLNQLRLLAKRYLPTAKIAGITNMNREMYYSLGLFELPDSFDGKFKDLASPGSTIVMNVIFFERSEVSVHHFKIEENCCELHLGGNLGLGIRDTKYVRAAMIYTAGEKTSVEDFVTMAFMENSGIPVFGSRSALRMDDEKNGLCGYVFDDEVIYDKGFVVVIFKGKELNIRTGYNLGWTPIGKKMTITEMEGEKTVKKIDGRPATEVYRKYLGLKHHQLVSENVCEFPFVLEREGMLIARIGLGTDDPDALEFSAPVYVGDEIRLSYGNAANIFNESNIDSREVKDFEPQALILVACMNRSLLLKKDIQQELDFYRRYSSDMAVMHGHSEMLYDRGSGGELNSALVSVVMREGDKRGYTAQLPVESSGCVLNRTMVPLTQRLITFLEATTQELADAMIEAKRANQAKSDFLSNVSHEIRTPINAVLGLDEMILRETRDDNIRNYATDIQNSGRNLLSLINDILDSSRIESGKMEIIPVEYELSSMLNDLVNMTQVRAKEKDLRLVVNVDKGIPHQLVGDDTRIRQCALNILTNAVKYTREGEITLDVTYRDLGDDEIELGFRVSDTGIGIKKEDMEKLYGRFERIEEDRNRSIEGTGLGMSIVQNLLSMMDSKLEVESVYGEGSVFSFAVKQKVKDPEPIGDFTRMYRKSMEAKNNYSESFHAPDARILVVDDTRMNLTVIRGLLKETKIGIDTTETGESALVMVRNKKYDAIFLDQRMPEMDGIETFRRMKHLYDSQNKDTPVIMLTANAIAGAREMFLAEGFDDYLSKPVNGKKLEQMLLKHLPDEKILPISQNDSASDESKDEDADPGSGFISSLSRIDGFNVGEGLSNCMNEDLLKETIKDFVSAGASGPQEIRNHLKNNDIENYTIRVHALKSSSRIIGAGELSEQAKYLEACGDENNISEIERLTPKLLEDYEALTARLGEALGTDDDAGSPKQDTSKDDAAGDEEKLPLISEDELSSALSAIRELVEAFDFDGAAGLHSMLLGYSMPPRWKERIAGLPDMLRRLDRDGILEALKE